MEIDLAAFVFAAPRGFTELSREPVLSVAAVLLMVVSLAWVLVARMITVNMRKAAYRRLRAQGRRTPAGKDVWSNPP